MILGIDQLISSDQSHLLLKNNAAKCIKFNSDTEL